MERSDFLKRAYSAGAGIQHQKQKTPAQGKRFYIK